MLSEIKSYALLVNEALGRIATKADKINYPLGYVFAAWVDEWPDFIKVARPTSQAYFSFDKEGKSTLEEYLDSLDAEVEEFREVARYQQREEEFDALSEIFTLFKEKNNLSAIWSVYDKIDFNAAAGFGKIQVHYTDDWGKDIFIEVDCPTWGDLYITADKLIQMSGDFHHIFIEGFDLVNSDYYLRTGS